MYAMYASAGRGLNVFLHRVAAQHCHHNTSINHYAWQIPQLVMPSMLNTVL